MSGKWTNIEKAYLVKNHSKMTNAQIARKLNRSKSSICSKVSELGLKKITRWTKEMDNELTDLYQKHTAAEISEIMELSKYAVENRRHKLKLSKNENAGCFKKGQTPPNKGKKMSPEVYKKVKRTFFQPGHTPGNHKPVGSARLSRDGYYEIKTKEPRTWEFVHRLIWKAHHNQEIGKNEIVIFKDGNCENLAIDNLEKIDRAQHIANMRESDNYISFLLSRDKGIRQEILKPKAICVL